MNDEEGYVSDSSSVSSIDLGEIPTELPDSALETPTHLTERLNREMTILLGSYRSTLPPVLREGLHTPDSYHGSDYEDLVNDDGEPINPQEAFSEFDDCGTGPKWKAFQKALKEKKKTRLAQQGAELVDQQTNRFKEEQEVEKTSSENSDDEGSSSSSYDEETPTVMDWDIVEGVTKKAKQEPNPTEWISNIDWASLEISPAVSPSKRSSINPLIESLRTANWRKLGSLPHYGWTLKGKRALGIEGKCDLCNRPLQHGHVLFHQEAEKEICVGRICAGHLRKDKATIERESEARLASEPVLNDLITAIQSLSVQ